MYYTLIISSHHGGSILIKIYADGAYNPVTGQGGWGAVVVSNGKKQILSGGTKSTTNNRMEIKAALEGILSTPSDSEVIVYTDSQYLYGCMAKGWQRRANLDLWKELDSAVEQRKVRWEWIDQNAGNPLHKEAHNLATGLASRSERTDHLPSEQQEPSPQPGAGELTHIDDKGKPCMVDVSQKPDTVRQAIAKGTVRMQASTFRRIKEGQIAKGDVLAVAQLAGIMAAKQTPHIIPLCHPVLIGNVKVEFELQETTSTIDITASATATGKTGVEMEALTAVAAAALTIYDMCKAVDRGMKIDNIRLVRKSGGKSGTFETVS
jgi:cyclic pyranopterin phosphate synthase